MLHLPCSSGAVWNIYKRDTERQWPETEACQRLYSILQGHQHGWQESLKLEKPVLATVRLAAQKQVAVERETISKDEWK